MKLLKSKKWLVGLFLIAMSSFVGLAVLTPAPAQAAFRVIEAEQIGGGGTTVTSIIDDNDTTNDNDDVIYTRSGDQFISNSVCPRTTSITEVEGGFELRNTCLGQTIAGEPAVTADPRPITLLSNDGTTELTTVQEVVEAGETGEAAPEDISCFSSLAPLGWLICPVVSLVVGAVEGILDFILGG